MDVNFPTHTYIFSSSFAIMCHCLPGWHIGLDNKKCFHLVFVMFAVLSHAGAFVLTKRELFHLQIAIWGLCFSHWCISLIGKEVFYFDIAKLCLSFLHWRNTFILYNFFKKLYQSVVPSTKLAWSKMDIESWRSLPLPARCKW